MSDSVPPTLDPIVEIPEHVRAALGLHSNVPREALLAFLEQGNFPERIFGLANEDFVRLLAESHSSAAHFQVSNLRRSGAEWRYLELSTQGVIECEAISTPDVGTEKPTTAAGRLLAQAWMRQAIVVESEELPRGVLIRRSALPRIDPSAEQLITQWANVGAQLSGSVATPVWISGTQLIISSGGRYSASANAQSLYRALFAEVVSEIKTKWRFLSIYRVLEHGYLSAVFGTLKLRFFVSPTEAVSEASDALQSELKQFVALVDGSSLIALFEKLHDEFSAQVTAQNRFANALEGSINKSGQIKQVVGKWQKGVLIFYKIRCSIVHAGLSSPIFDSFPDGASCLEALLPASESIVLEFLGITAA